MSHSGNWTDLVPGAFYRDLDGTRVRLVRLAQELCTWAPVGDATHVQVTHAYNFRLRFRRWNDSDIAEAKSRDSAA